MTDDPATLWLVIVASAVGTGLLLWLVKYLLDEDLSPSSDTADQPGQDEEPRLTWVLVQTTTGVPLHTLHACQPAPHAAVSAGEPLPITAAQPPHARHRKGNPPCI